MRIKAVLFFVLCVAAWGCSQDSSDLPDDMTASGDAIDLGAIELFWQIVDLLSQDEEPSPELWEALFATPGYSALTQSEFEPSFFHESFRLAYMPSLNDSFSRALEEEKNHRRLRHYRKVVERRAELETFSENLKHSNRMTEFSRLAAEWLPRPSPDKPAPLAVVVFDMDARGYDPIVIDLLAAKELDLDSFLAHEAHHWYRNDRATIDWDDGEPHEADLLWTLYQVQGEGIADQIDKRPWIEGEVPPPAVREDYTRSYFDALAATPSTIRALDSLLVAFDAATEIDEQATIGARVAELVPMSGHPTGYYMARTILETLGRERLVTDIANPVAFFLTYDEAARASGRQGFSPEALSVLTELEARFSH